MIEGIPLVDIGQSALLSLVFLAVLTDKLVWHKRLAERQRKIDALEKRIDELVKQNGLLLDSAIPATNAVMNALHQALETDEES